MKNRYTIYLSASILAILITAGLANAQNTISVSGAGTAGANGTYTYVGMSNSRPYYTNGSYTLEYRYDFNNWDDYVWMIYSSSSTNYLYAR